MPRAAHNALLAPHESPPFEVVNAGGRAPLLLVCDHASNAIPEALQELGLSRAARELHIAWDRGAAEVTRALARRLDAPAVLAKVSRLVVDLNRAPDSAESILAQSDGVRVPGNEALDAAARRARVREIFEPYHATLADLLARQDAREPHTLFVPVHSFTPSLSAAARAKQGARPWHFGVLWRHDARIAAPLLAALRRQADLCIGDNQPYSGHSTQNYSVDFHAPVSRKPVRPSAAIEIREDLIRDAAGQAWASNLLGEALEKIIADPATWRAAGATCVASAANVSGTR